MGLSQKTAMDRSTVIDRPMEQVTSLWEALGSQHAAVEGGGLRDATKPQEHLKNNKASDLVDLVALRDRNSLEIFGKVSIYLEIL